jgi:hypothetical protein
LWGFRVARRSVRHLSLRTAVSAQCMNCLTVSLPPPGLTDGNDLKVEAARAPRPRVIRLMGDESSVCGSSQQRSSYDARGARRTEHTTEERSLAK